MALHCTSFLAMYAPSKYGGGVAVCGARWRGGVGEGERRRERQKKGGGGVLGGITCFC